MATLLSQLTKQPLHGPRIMLLLHRLLPPGLVAAIEVIIAASRPSRPSAMLFIPVSKCLVSVNVAPRHWWGSQTSSMQIPGARKTSCTLIKCWAIV